MVIAVRQGDKGLSYEMSEVDVNTAAWIWEPVHFVFTGAAILNRCDAAYQDSSIELT